MGRRPCCDKVGLKRGPWTIEEDHKLMNFILNNGIHCWRSVPKLADLLRCGKSCRLRWINYLRPDLKRGEFTEAEEDQIIHLHSRLGNKWSKIASNFPGRTDNEIKNHWNTRIKKRLKHMGLDPLTHKPVQEAEQSDDDKSKTNPEPNSSELTLNNNRGSNKEQVESEVQTLGQTSDLFSNNYDVLWGSFDNSIGSNTCTSSYSSSESATVDDQTQNSLQLQQWVEGVDSILSWDLFDHLEEDLFFLGNNQ